ncbi:serine hydrolase domain-containing protein [Sphingomonas profundi]|uniref:serine hydrolase domain-containing protein n=1 Tax=Alterirhizorhabdus profundi TaxID=2681549 RepID=UPI0012E6F8AB|nr:serine hydrolase domain-containing protein [Sphingomonas profundi]
MIRRALLGAAITAVAAAPAPAVHAQAAPVHAAPDAARLDGIVAAAGFSGVALVGQGEGIAWQRSVGEASPGVPHAAESVWRLASVTKQLTALIVMQEVAAGRLDLDAPMATLWPGWPAPDAATITPRLLLTHDSGLADPAESRPDKDGIPEFYRRVGPAADPARSAADFCARSPRARAGSGYHYDNCDFIVLGGLLERLTGTPFAALLQQRIAQPLGLASLGLFRFDATPARHVRGTVGGRAEPALNLGTYGAAGSAYISPRDLWAFDRALMENRLLDRIQTRAMWAGDPALGFAAFGAWSYATRLAGCPDTVDLIERRGMIGGVQIRNFLNPARRAAVILFTNTAEFDFGEVGEGRGFAYDMLSAAFCPAP